MLTSTKVAISALLLALSASGALAQYASPGPTYGVSTDVVRPYYTVRHHKPAPPRQPVGQTYGNDVPFAPF
jgi:hypothetical protein